MHAKRSPSGADRWVVCPGSIAMSAGYPDESSDDADRGTARHLIFAKAIQDGFNIDDALGVGVSVGAIPSGFDGAFFTDELPEGFEVRRSYVMDRDDIAILRTAVYNAREMTHGAVAIELEAEVPISHMTGEDGAVGYADLVAILDEPGGGSSTLRVIEVHDFKSGRNEVSPTSRQLRMYGSGARRLFDAIYGPFDKVRAVVHQPIVSQSPMVAEYTAAEIDDFEIEIRKAAQISVEAENSFITWKDKPGPYLRPGLTDGEDQCRYCPASGHCPGQDEALTQVIGAEFAAMTPPPKKDGPPPAFPEWGKADAETLGRRLAAVPFVKAWAQAVEDRAYNVLMKGGEVTGFKLVQGRQGNRAWTSKEEAEAEMKKMRLTLDQMYVQMLKSPTAMEAELEGIPKKWERLQAFISRADGKPTLAPLSDKRKAIKPPGAADAGDFENRGAPPTANPEDML